MSSEATPTKATGEANAGAALLIAVLAIIAVVAASAASNDFWKDANFKELPGAVAPLEGLTIFAVFFVAATAIERLLEPLAGLISNKKAVEAADTRKAAQESVETAAAAESTEAKAAAGTAASAVQTAANASAAASVANQQRKVILWAAASIIGVAASANMKLYLLTTVGIARPSRGMEILATGLIIGAGTQPLHNLTELISAKKEQAKAASPGGGG